MWIKAADRNPTLEDSVSNSNIFVLIRAENRVPVVARYFPSGGKWYTINWYTTRLIDENMYDLLEWRSMLDLE